ncbi:hypothetical protein EW146_g1762 [Bondarzewia mesenterica]|uniref:Uncharacterized protein n=1 Tax=Bondarzewia mesenterica TaxID=1095465 RepID=A0A4S4M3B3_9AGAM|nr:hypothetical protein EW146_g1762 [Bondarzewia mesenterica]
MAVADDRTSKNKVVKDCAGKALSRKLEDIQGEPNQPGPSLRDKRCFGLPSQKKLSPEKSFARNRDKEKA